MPKQQQHKTLREAMRDGQFVRFTRRFEDGFVRGYVLDVGPEFFLLLLVGNAVRFDGFQCFRVRDVRNFMPDPYAAFAEAALKKRRERKPPKPRISLATLGEILTGANRVFPLVTIHREQVAPHSCHIGRVLGADNGRVALLEIGPNAEWDDAASEYRMKEITRVDFGGDYEDALHVVGGNPPKRR